MTTAVEWKSSHWNTTTSFHEKLRSFGLSHTNHVEPLKSFYKVRILDTDAETAYEWCQANHDNNWIWSSPTQTNYTDIYFKTEADALIFKLTFNTI